MKLHIEIPEGTDEIFNLLREGGYLCANHPDEKHSTLYRRCRSYETGLSKYFAVSGLNLVCENDFYYFEDLNEGDAESPEVEKELKAYLLFINFHIVLTKILNYVQPGTIFTLAEIEQNILDNISLSSMYKKNDRDSIRKEIEKDVKLFVSNGYLYRTSSSSEQYIVLSSFNRLLDFLSLIEVESVKEVKEEMQKEIEIDEAKEEEDANE